MRVITCPFYLLNAKNVALLSSNLKKCALPIQMPYERPARECDKDSTDHYIEVCPISFRDSFRGRRSIAGHETERGGAMGPKEGRGPQQRGAVMKGEWFFEGKWWASRLFFVYLRITANLNPHKLRRRLFSHEPKS